MVLQKRAGSAIPQRSRWGIHLRDRDAAGEYGAVRVAAAEEEVWAGDGVHWRRAGDCYGAGELSLSWLDLIENPEAVKSTFEVEPSLNGVEVISVLFHRDGPTVDVEIALSEQPSRLSARWERVGVNAVNLKLQLLGVETLMLDGWATKNRGTIDIRPGSTTKVEVHINGPTMQFRCCCQWLRIAGLNGYRRE